MSEPFKFSSVDQYVDRQTAKVSGLLKQLRKCVISAAPGVEETISYNMPGYKLDGPLVYFAAYDHHIGFYPMPSAIEKFASQLKKFTVTKGGIRFSLDEPLPLSLISRIVKFRVKENIDKRKIKNRK